MNETQLAILASFRAVGVEYVVVGGVAVNAHGYVRATNDLDLFIRPTIENASAACEALKNSGITPERLEPGDVLNDEDHLRIGPREDHVDILASIGEMPFDQAWRNHIERNVAGLSFPFISKADLIENKLQIGRLRGLADVEELRLIPDDE